MIEKIWALLSEKFLFADRNSKLLTFSEKDAAIVKEKYNRDATVVNFYLSSMILSLDKAGTSLKNFFCLFGAWNRPENHEGLEWFIKNVAHFTNDIKYIVIGVNLPVQLQKLISEYQNIEYMGYVDNPYEIIAESKALIAPLFKGAGVKVKVIEALACGTQVIGTPIALEGIKESMTGSLIACYSKDDFINQVQNFATSDKKKSMLRESFLNQYKSNSNLFDLIKME